MTRPNTINQELIVPRYWPPKSPDFHPTFATQTFLTARLGTVIWIHELRPYVVLASIMMRCVRSGAESATVRVDQDCRSAPVSAARVDFELAGVVDLKGHECPVDQHNRSVLPSIRWLRGQDCVVENVLDVIAIVEQLHELFKQRYIVRADFFASLRMERDFLNLQFYSGKRFQ